MQAVFPRITFCKMKTFEVHKWLRYTDDHPRYKKLSYFFLICLILIQLIPQQGTFWQRQGGSPTEKCTHIEFKNNSNPKKLRNTSIYEATTHCNIICEYLYSFYSFIKSQLRLPKKFHNFTNLHEENTKTSKMNDSAIRYVARN